jgi:hypothetical protein
MEQSDPVFRLLLQRSQTSLLDAQAVFFAMNAAKSANPALLGIELTTDPSVIECLVPISV